MQYGQYSFENTINLLPFIICCALKDSSTYLGLELEFDIMVEVILKAVDRLAVAAVFAENWFLVCCTDDQRFDGFVGVEAIGAVAAVKEEPNPGRLPAGPLELPEDAIIEM